MHRFSARDRTNDEKLGRTGFFWDYIGEGSLWITEAHYSKARESRIRTDHAEIVTRIRLTIRRMLGNGKNHVIDLRETSHRFIPQSGIVSCARGARATG